MGKISKLRLNTAGTDKPPREKGVSAEELAVLSSGEDCGNKKPPTNKKRVPVD